MMSTFWSSVLWFVAGAAVAAVITFFVSRNYFQKDDSCNVHADGKKTK